jgi:hypothetical protein
MPQGNAEVKGKRSGSDVGPGDKKENDGDIEQNPKWMVVIEPQVQRQKRD